MRNQPVVGLLQLPRKNPHSSVVPVVICPYGGGILYWGINEKPRINEDTRFLRVGGEKATQY